MMKEEKINYIKAWLQMFGERDNETFSIQVKVGEVQWDISMQYNYDIEERCRIDPYSWCRSGFKHVNNTGLDDRSEEELSGIIKELEKIKTFY